MFEVDSADEAWKLVAIGDSFIGWTTNAEQYAELLEDDLGVEISVDKIVNSTSNVAAAVGRGIGWVDVSRAFSGPVYERVVDERYFEADRTHLTDEGSRIVAELLNGLSAT